MIEHDLADLDKAPWRYDVASTDDNDSIDTDGHLQGLTIDPITSWGLIGYKTYNAEQLAELIRTNLDNQFASGWNTFNFFDIPDMDPAWGKSWFTQSQNPCMEITLGQHEQPKQLEQPQPEQSDQETYYSPFDGETK